MDISCLCWSSALHILANGLLVMPCCPGEYLKHGFYSFPLPSGCFTQCGHSAYPFSPSPLPFSANDWFSCLSEAQRGPIEMKGTGDCCLSTAWTKPITNKQGTEFKNKLFWYNHFEKLFLQYLLKLKINISMIKPSYSQEKYTSMLTKETLQIATLFVIALIWKQPKCPSRRE